MYQTYIPGTRFDRYTRIHCYLGYNCNIQCDFCKNRLFDKQPNKTTIASTIDAIDQLQLVDSETVIHLSGGELYQDQFDISIYVPMLETHPGIPKTTITNLLYHDIDRCIDLWKQYDVEVQTSYDSFGRFKTPQMTAQWLKNLDYLKSKQIQPIVNVIATPFCIKDPLLQTICNENRVFFSPLENKKGSIVLLNQYHDIINKYECINIDTTGYQCEVIAINDTYVNEFCNRTINISSV